MFIQIIELNYIKDLKILKLIFIEKENNILKN